MPNENQMRRTPQQVRGQRRVSQILDAAAEVFVEKGYEAATTNAIAIRANTSIGSLYQFFPNKRSILEALANRYQMQLRTVLDGVKSEADEGSLQHLLTLLVDDLVTFYTSNITFQPMFYVSQSSKTLTLIADEVCAAIVEHVNQTCSKASPDIEPELCKFYASVIVFMMRAFIPLSQNQDSPFNALVVPQLKRMIFAYLASLEPFGAHEFSYDD